MEKSKKKHSVYKFLECMQQQNILENYQAWHD